MTMLTDIQLVLLTTAANRPGGGLLPPPESLGASAARIRKAVASLMKLGLAEEIATGDAVDAWRQVEGRCIGVIITDEGRATIAAEVKDVAEDLKIAGHPLEISAVPVIAPTKTAAVIGMLLTDTGATVADLVAATGWLPHTTRAALTGLRKKGYALTGTKEGKTTRYHIAADVAA